MPPGGAGAGFPRHRKAATDLRGPLGGVSAQWPGNRTHAPGWVLLPLRAFLGVTFTYASLQKLSDRNFFSASDPSSIQAQIAAAERTSPIHALLSTASHAAVPLGVLIALGELAVGVGTLLGLWTRVAAAGGMLISLMLFLTVSFHSHPYFTGSDIVFLFAWMPLLVAGAGDVWSLDALLALRARRHVGLEPDPVVPIDFATVRQLCGFFDDGRCRERQGAPCEPGPCPVLATHPSPSADLARQLDRRTFFGKSAAAGAAAGAALFAGGLTALVGRMVSGSSSASSVPALHPSRTAPPASSPSSASSPSAGSPSTTAPAAQPSGTPIGSASAVPVGGAASFQDPTSGDPAFVVQPRNGQFVGFDAICPHAGCTVEAQSRIFACPCHGSQFNLDTGAVLQGPATTGLSRIRVTRAADGQLYA